MTERRLTTSTYFHTCPRCGAHLDPGEKCDCQSTRELYGGFIRAALDQGRVPDVLQPLCRHALEEPTTPLDTLRTLCQKLKELNGSENTKKVSTVDTLKKKEIFIMDDRMTDEEFIETMKEHPELWGAFKQFVLDAKAQQRERRDAPAGQNVQPSE